MNNKWTPKGLLLKLVACFCSFATLEDNDIIGVASHEKTKQTICFKKLDYESNYKLSFDHVESIESSSHLLTNDREIKTTSFDYEQIYLKMYKIYIKIITNFLEKFYMPIISENDGIKCLKEIAELLNPVVSKTFISKMISIHIDKIKILENSLKGISTDLEVYLTHIIANVRKAILKEKEKLVLIKNVLRMSDCELINVINMKNNDINDSIIRLDLLESSLNILIAVTIPELMKSLKAAKVELIRMDAKTMLLIIRVKKFINDIISIKEKNMIEINNFLSKGANILQILKFNKKYLNFISTLYDVLFKARELIENFDEIKKYLDRTILDILPI